MKKIIFSGFVLLIAGTKTISQNVGIGTAPNIPLGKLEVRGDGNDRATNNLVLRNLIGDTLLRIRNDGRVGMGFNSNIYGRTLNIGGPGINLYKDEATLGGALIPTDSSLILWSNNADNKYVILQPEWGKVGIGTYSPKAMLDVKGSVVLGDGGSVITKMIKLTVIKNITSIAANTASIETFTVPGAATGSSVHISPGSALADGLVISYARVSAANTVEVKFMNVSAATITHGLTAFFITVID